MSDLTIDFDSTFRALTRHAPFPWQRRLFDRLSNGDLPPAIDIPTGLGKTAVMAVWLLARATGALLPRRLVYVVDRRAVVDQATDFAVQLRERLQGDTFDQARRKLGLGDRPLPISTLRGQHVDNREWLDDPAAPAIIVGTVDMIGSRLLFEGYGVSRRMRPFQAGLMGCDTLVLLDEAHLSLPFKRLLRTIEEERRVPVPGKFAGPAASADFPPAFRMLPLSATLGFEPDSASASSAPITLNGEDLENETVRARFHASKTLTVKALGKNEEIEAALAERAWDLALRQTEAAGRPVRMLVYCNSRKVADSVAEDLQRRKKRSQSQWQSKAAVILFVGGRRVHEREAAADELRQHGLLAGDGGSPSALVFVVATSAGEVGVDLDADHMVCDLVAWERMVQRLGRVNRRGSGAASVLVIDQGPPEKKSAQDVARHHAVKALLMDLPPAGEGRQAGPSALAGAGRSSVGSNRVEEASTAMPLYPALTRPLIDAWAMTSLTEHSGRPEVEPWLRGWVKQDPQTTVVWRRCLPVRIDTNDRGTTRTVRLADKAVEEFFEAASPHAAERLETETSRVVEWLRKRARKLKRTLDAALRDGGAVEHKFEAAETGDGESLPAIAGVAQTASLHPDAPAAFILDSSGKPDDSRSNCVLSWKNAAEDLSVKDLERRLAGRLLVVDAKVCGLENGLLKTSAGEPVPTAENNWDNAAAWDEAAPGGAASAVRVRLISDTERTRLTSEPQAAGANPAGETAEAWREAWAAQYRVSSADEPVTWLIVEKWRGAAPNEESRSMATALQRLEEHQEQAVQEADRIATELGLRDEDRTMIVAAARHHDDGKRARRWQRAFNAPTDGGPYAKTRGPFNRHVLNGYRHEFQSMLDAEDHGLEGLDRSDSRFELALHLIAAHHGHARPTIGIDGCDRLPPTAAAQRAFVIGQRFACLQKQWGPWGLAWWEALLRAADQRASRALDGTAGRASGNPAVRRSPAAPPSSAAGRSRRPSPARSAQDTSRPVAGAMD